MSLVGIDRWLERPYRDWFGRDERDLDPESDGDPEEFDLDGDAGLEHIDEGELGEAGA